LPGRLVPTATATGAARGSFTSGLAARSVSCQQPPRREQLAADSMATAARRPPCANSHRDGSSSRLAAQVMDLVELAGANTPPRREMLAAAHCRTSYAVCVPTPTATGDARGRHAPRLGRAHARCQHPTATGAARGIQRPDCSVSTLAAGILCQHPTATGEARGVHGCIIASAFDGCQHPTATGAVRGAIPTIPCSCANTPPRRETLAACGYAVLALPDRAVPTRHRDGSSSRLDDLHLQLIHGPVPTPHRDGRRSRLAVWRHHVWPAARANTPPRREQFAAGLQRLDPRRRYTVPTTTATGAVRGCARLISRLAACWAVPTPHRDGSSSRRGAATGAARGRAVAISSMVAAACQHPPRRDQFAACRPCDARSGPSRRANTLPRRTLLAAALDAIGKSSPEKVPTSHRDGSSSRPEYHAFGVGVQHPTATGAARGSQACPCRHSTSTATVEARGMGDLRVDAGYPP
jgi:hypothetical protein